MERGDLQILLRFAQHSGLLDVVSPQYEGGQQFNVSLTLAGHERVDAVLARRPESKQAFVAMWFNESMLKIYEDAIAPAIRGAGYVPMRIDLKEHNNKIDDEIISEIRRSKFLVADLTARVAEVPNTVGQTDRLHIPRGGVYFEAGFAKGLGIEVVWTCKDDQVDNLHFDIRQYNNVTWKDAADLRLRLEARITATLGDGPLRKAP